MRTQRTRCEGRAEGRGVHTDEAASRTGTPIISWHTPQCFFSSLVPDTDATRLFQPSKVPIPLYQGSKPRRAIDFAVQVHRAWLDDGTAVAVKVQHAHLRRQIDADLLVLDVLAAAVPLLFEGTDLRWILNSLRTR